MPAPHREDVEKQSELTEKWPVGGPESPLDYGTTDGLGPGNFKTRQVQRRYRSLFLQASREVYLECYQGWCQGEEDSQRAVGSVCHLLDRLQMLEGAEHEDARRSLGDLAHLPGFQALMIRKHIMELERVMRLWRALVQQMKGQVSRIQEAVAEAWQIHRSEARVLMPSGPATSQGSQRPASRAPFIPEDKSSRFNSSSRGNIGVSPATTHQYRQDFPVDTKHSPSGGERGTGAGSIPSTALGASPQRNAAAETSSPDSAQYLQWLGDMSRMLIHEQWRKEELLARLTFSQEESASRQRVHIQATWSSRSRDSFLDRASIDAALSRARVAPLLPTS